MRVQKNQTATGTIRFLYTNIGRGHPHYLDGVVEAMVKSGQVSLIKEKTDVFEVSRGLGRLGWQAARYLYRRGSSNPTVGRFYARLRRNNNYNRSTLASKVMGRQIRRRYLSDSSPLMVAHPSLVGIMAGRSNLFYQHGEVIAPDESLALGAEVCFVPTDTVRDRFLAAGYRPEQVAITGLCVETALADRAEESFFERLIRLEQSPQLTCALFSSGAEPIRHIKLIVRSALALTEAGHKALIFAFEKGNLGRIIEQEFRSAGRELSVVDATNELPGSNARASLISFGSRREENHFTSALFPQFDLLVAPAHERTNWGLGLGLPIFVLNPCIGPFAPLNREILRVHGVSMEIDSIDHASSIFADIGSDSFRRRLQAMASAGWGKYEVDGFNKIVELLRDRLRKC